MNKFFKTAAFVLALGSMAAGFTSCGDDEDEVGEAGSATENLKVNDITAIAQKDGQITISGTIVSNTKIKTFELQDLDGNQIVDLLSDQLKEKGDDGKSFTMKITSTSVKVQEMYLVAKTKGNKEIKEKIGDPYSFVLGYGSKSEKGSYVSIVDQKSYTKSEVESSETTSANVEFVLSDGGLKPASEAKNAATVTNYAKSAIYEGTIITSTGCIATYTLTPDADEIDGTLSGVVINSKGSIKIKAADDVVLSK